MYVCMLQAFLQRALNQLEAGNTARNKALLASQTKEILSYAKKSLTSSATVQMNRMASLLIIPHVWYDYYLATSLIITSQTSNLLKKQS